MLNECQYLCYWSGLILEVIHPHPFSEGSQLKGGFGEEVVSLAADSSRSLSNLIKQMNRALEGGG